MTLAASALVVLAGATPASAHHSASATASLAMDPPSPRCKLVERSHRSKCRGSRLVRVTWSVACSAEYPLVEVKLWTPRPGKSPVVFDSREEGTHSGVTTFHVEAGTRVFATVEVLCDFEGDGETIDYHRVRAESAPTVAAFNPPRLVLVENVGNSFCGVVPTIRQLSRTLQARETSSWDLDLIFNADSLLAVKRRSAAWFRRIRIHARGAGLRGSARARPWVPGAIGPITTQAGVRLVPRRGGRLKIWAVIGGEKTNVLSLKVFPKRC